MTSTITNPETNPHGTWFSVVGENEAMPPVFTAAATRAKSQVAFRLAGGCSGMTNEKRMLVGPYFIEGLKGYDGVAISGATDSPDALPMVTNVPGILASEYGAIALGTCPRTADMALPDSGSVSVSKYGDTIDRAQHAVAVVQRNAANVLDWNGDLEAYLGFLSGLRDEAQWKIAVIVFNGGGVTNEEFNLAIAWGIPVIVIDGSERFADVCHTQWIGGDLSAFDEKTCALALSDEDLERAKNSGLVHFASFDDPATLTTAAREVGLLK